MSQISMLAVTTVLVGWLSGGGLVAMVLWVFACGVAWWVGIQAKMLLRKSQPWLRKVSKRLHTLR